MNKHRCGGWLHPAKVKIQKRMGVYFQSFTVDGFQCDSCGEEIISRDTALEIDKTVHRLRNLWKIWRIPADTRDSLYLQYSTPAVNTMTDKSLFRDTTNNVPKYI